MRSRARPSTPPEEHPRKARPTPGLGVTVTPGNAAPGARPAGVLGLDGTTQDPNLTGVEYDIGYGARVFMPSDWEVTQIADTRIWRSRTARASYAFAAVGKYADASVRAGDVIEQSLEGLLPPDKLHAAAGPPDPTTSGPCRMATSSVSSSLDYQALWADAQGSVEIYGQIYAGVRKDGAALVVLIEHVPPDDWNETLYPRAAIVEQSFLRFAGKF